MKTGKSSKQTISSSTLLTPQEQAICKQIVDREVPHSQRAVALLALNENSTQAQAAEKSGLSLGQIKYWVAEFRNKRLEIFPEVILEGLSANPKKGKATGIKVDSEVEVVTEKKASVEDESKETKGKKSKKKAKKKEKKARKDKKNKKGKKAKKSKK